MLQQTKLGQSLSNSWYKYNSFRKLLVAQTGTKTMNTKAIVLTTRRHETPSKNFSKLTYLTFKTNKKQREIGLHDCEVARLLPKNLSCTVKLKTLHNESHYYSADDFITSIAPITVFMALANTAQGPFFTEFRILVGIELK